MMKKSDARSAVKNRKSGRVMWHLFGVAVVLLMLCLAVTSPATAANIWDGSIADDFAVGDGTAANPYQISSGAELALLGNKTFTDQCFILTDDIDLNGLVWTSIPSFDGTFDGKGYTILNMYVPSGGGLFNSVTYDSIIRNVQISNASVSGTSNVGVLCGSLKGVVINCHVYDSTVTASGDNVGGIVGSGTSGITIESSSITNSKVNGHRSVGGIVGYLSHGTTANPSTIKCSDCLSVDCLISGFYYVGGICGQSYGDYKSYIQFNNCVIVGGHISANVDYTGGIVGYGYCYTTVKNSIVFVNDIYCSGNNVHPVVSIINSGNGSGNFVSEDILINNGVVTHLSSSLENGHFIDSGFVWNNKAWWQNRGLDFSSIWIMGDTLEWKLPYLSGQTTPSYDASYIDSGYTVSPMENDLPFAWGDGTAASPYMIISAEGVDAIRLNPSACYKLADDISLSPYISWYPISEFSGTFDGDGYIISDLSIDSTLSSVGLFSSTTSSSIIRNVQISNASVSGTSNVGVLCGSLKGVVINCHVYDSTVTASGDNVGGIVGSGTSGITIESSSITNSKVNGHRSVGGIVGYLSHGTTANPSTIKCSDCLSVDCLISGFYYVGGICGQSYGDYKSYIQFNNCVIVGGHISANVDYAGGIVGCDYCYTTIKDSIVFVNDIYCSGNNVHPVVSTRNDGDVSGSGTYVFEYIRINSNSYIPSGSLNDGTAIDKRQYWNNQTWWESIGYDFTEIWEMGTDTYYKLPYLKAHPITYDSPSDIYLSVTSMPLTGTITISTADSLLKVDEAVTLPVVITNAENIGGFKAYIANDVPGLTITINESQPQSGNYDINSDASQDKQVISWTTTELWGLESTAELFFIDITVDDITLIPTDEIALTLTILDLCDANGKDIRSGYEVENSKIRVHYIYELKNTVESGEWNAVTPASITYELHPSFVEDVAVPVIYCGAASVSLTDVSAAKVLNGISTPISVELSETGVITLSETVSDDYLLQVTFSGRVLGDITGDGVVNTADKIRIGQFVAEKITLDDIALFYADITQDGSVETGDKLKLGQYVAEKLDESYLPITGAAV